MGDEDENDQNVSIGVTRYPCMPSLVALQQMRNRLHLAHLGKKLMKWTAMATGREQRRVASHLHEIYENYSEDMRNAYISLARSRYYYPQLNTMVTEAVGHKASITLTSTLKTVAGVKVMLYEVKQNEKDSYSHLGIEKGGQQIEETKRQWRELLLKLIKMQQERESFRMLEQANRAATKKINVLSKIITPKTILTMQYIILELKEIDGEEFTRMKRIIQNKQKHKLKLEEEKTKYENKSGQKEVPLDEPKPEMSKALDQPLNEDKRTCFDEIYLAEIEELPSVNDTNYINLLKILRTYLDSIMQYIEEYKSNGIKDTVVEDFHKSFKCIRFKINSYLEQDVVASAAGLDIAKEKPHGLILYNKAEMILSQSSIEDFIHCCENFKFKLKKQFKAKHKSEMTGNKTENNIGQQRESAKFVNTKLKHEADQKIIEKLESGFIDKLRSNIEVVISMILRLRPTSGEPKLVLDVFSGAEQYETHEFDEYSTEDSLKDVYKEKILPVELEELLLEKTSPQPCETGKDEKPPTISDSILSQESKQTSLPLCETYDNNNDKQSGSNNLKYSEQSCNLRLQDENKIGYFEIKVHKITKIKRSRNADGTILEEKETITITQEKYNSNINALDEDDEINEFESLVFNDKTKTVLYTNKQKSKGFFRKTRSECLSRIPIIGPRLRSSVSADAGMCPKEELLRVINPTETHDLSVSTSLQSLQVVRSLLSEECAVNRFENETSSDNN